MLRLKCQGSSTEYCYIDDIEICYENTWEPEEPEYILGDVDDNGIVDIADVSALIDYLLNSDTAIINMLAADISQDNQIMIDDVSLLIDMLLSKM